MLRRVPPSLLGGALRLSGRGRYALAQFAVFERHGRAPLAFLDGYREHGKGSWRSFWWSTRALLALHARLELPPYAVALRDALVSTPTLPASPAVFADVVAEIGEKHAGAVKSTGRYDPRLGREILAVPVSDEQIAHFAGAIRRSTRQVLARLAAFGLDVPRAAILDAGCGTGYAAFAVAGEGAGAVVGVDLDPEGSIPSDEIARMREHLAPGRDVSIERGDLAHLGFPGASFDAIYSTSVVEHLVELPAVFAELRRVLRPGGLAHHGFDPWFGPAGGHSVCTLDVPWGHVRLDEEEFVRYVETFRPYEANDAVSFYCTAFQRPRLTLGQTAQVAREAGFDVVVAERTPLRMRDPHRAWFDSTLLRECRRLYPAVTPDDLLAAGATLVLRRR